MKPVFLFITFTSTRKDIVSVKIITKKSLYLVIIHYFYYYCPIELFEFVQTLAVIGVGDWVASSEPGVKVLVAGLTVDCGVTGWRGETRRSRSL